MATVPHYVKTKDGMEKIIPQKNDLEKIRGVSLNRFELIRPLGIKYEKGFLYFVKNGQVMKKVFKEKGKAIKVMDLDDILDMKTFVYAVDLEGWLIRSKRLVNRFK